MRYRYRYSLDGARAAGVELDPRKDILLLAPDATDIESVREARCWLFCASTLAWIPTYVELIGGATTRAERAAQLCGLTVCPTCGEWLPKEWIDYVCHGPGKHDPVEPTHPTPLEVEREFRQATVNAVAAAVLVTLVIGVFAVIAWFSN